MQALTLCAGREQKEKEKQCVPLNILHNNNFFLFNIVFISLCTILFLLQICVMNFFIFQGFLISTFNAYKVRLRDNSKAFCVVVRVGQLMRNRIVELQVFNKVDEENKQGVLCK